LSFMALGSRVQVGVLNRCLGGSERGMRGECGRISERHGGRLWCTER
jgi:hypothetical protein